MAYLVQITMNPPRTEARISIVQISGDGATWQLAVDRAEKYALGCAADGCTVVRDFPAQEPAHGQTQAAD